MSLDSTFHRTLIAFIELLFKLFLQKSHVIFLCIPAYQFTTPFLSLSSRLRITLSKPSLYSLLYNSLATVKAEGSTDKVYVYTTQKNADSLMARALGRLLQVQTALLL